MKLTDLSNEAIRLTRAVHTLLPCPAEGAAEVAGLLALMLLTDARRSARTGPDGELIPLAEQDRTLWDARAISEGAALISDALPRGALGPYQLQAAINAVHSDAPSAAETDWPQILRLYDHLLQLTPTPVVSLNRAVAVAEVRGAHAALTEVDALGLDSYYLFHAIRADLLRRLGRTEEAIAACQAAAARTGNPAERALLARRIAALRGGP